MRRLISILVMATAMMVLGACPGGGPAQPRVSKISRDDGESIAITYDGSKIASAKTTLADGTVVSNATYTYKGDKIASITTQVTNGPAATRSFTYVDQGLSTVTITQDGDTETLTYTYADGRVSHMHENRTAQDGTIDDYNFDYVYKDGMLTKVNEIYVYTISGVSSPQTTASLDYTYDKNNRLTSMKMTVSDGTTATATYAYDGSGRLSTVTYAQDDHGQDDATYSVQYADDGKVSKVTQTVPSTGALMGTWTYTYENGDAAGFVVTPKDPLRNNIANFSNSIRHERVA